MAPDLTNLREMFQPSTGVFFLNNLPRCLQQKKPYDRCYVGYLNSGALAMACWHRTFMVSMGKSEDVWAKWSGYIWEVFSERSKQCWHLMGTNKNFSLSHPVCQGDRMNLNGSCIVSQKQVSNQFFPSVRKSRFVLPNHLFGIHKFCWVKSLFHPSSLGSRKLPKESGFFQQRKDVQVSGEIAAFSLQDGTRQESKGFLGHRGDGDDTKWQGIDTLPETNSKFAPEIRPSQKERIISQPSIFVGSLSYYLPWN